MRSNRRLRWIAIPLGLIVTLAQAGRYDEAEDYLKQMVTLDREGLWAFSAGTLLQAM